MLVYIYFLISLIFFISAFLVVKLRIVYLNSNPEKYNPIHNGHEDFLNLFFSILRVFIKKFILGIKIIYRNILHWWVLLTAKFSSYTDKIYTKSRNKFMEEVVKDKKAVPHFWNHLKKYKKEIDEEKEEEELKKEDNI